MLQNKEKYIMVKERQSEDVTIITFTKKQRKCDACLCLKSGRDIVIVKYPIMHRTMGRLIMDKKEGGLIQKYLEKGIDYLFDKKRRVYSVMIIVFLVMLSLYNSYNTKENIGDSSDTIFVEDN